MGVIVGLIAAGGVIAAGFLIAFAWAVRSGQFDDTASPPLRMLFDDPAPGATAVRSEGISHVHKRS
jgi:cbb3-type cytochrome oxidase maturation protein